MPVRTAQLSAGSLKVAGYYSACVVPAGYTYIVKTVTAVNLGASDSVLRLWGSSAGIAVLLTQLTLPTATVRALDYWIVAQPGTDLSWQLLNAVETHVWLSGTQLPGVQPFPSTTPALRLG